MFDRRNDNPGNQVNDAGSEFRPERMETAEFTMSSTPDADAPGPGAQTAVPVRSDGILDREQIDHRRAEWEDLQARFIDDPHEVVQQADQMVARTIDDIARALARERESLEQNWKDADDADTEDLRLTFQRYRELIDRVLSL